MSNKLMDAAVKLFHRSERDHWESVCKSLDGDFDNFKEINTNLWFWACKRWEEFPEREYQLREKSYLDHP